MIVLLIEFLFTLVFARALVTYLKRRDSLMRDVVLVFAAMAGLVIVDVYRRLIGPPPGLVADLLAARLSSVDLFPFLRRRRTYPGFLPFLHLDHIYFDGEIAVRRISLPRTRLALLASDHLPLVADIRVRF